MSRTSINISAAGSANNTIVKAKRNVTCAKDSFRSTANNVDSRIKNRNNINNRVTSIYNKLSDIEGKLFRISQTVQSGLQMYSSTDSRIEQNANNVQRNAVGAKKSSYYDFFTDNSGSNKETGKIRKKIVSFEDISAELKRLIKEILNSDNSKDGKRLSPKSIKKLFQAIWQDVDGIRELFEFTSGAAKCTGFNSTLPAYVGDISSMVLDTKGSDTKISDYLSSFSSLIDFIGNKRDSDKMSVAGSVFNYIGDLIGVVESKNDTTTNKTSSILSLLKSSVSVETGLFDYFEKSLHPYDAVKLDAKFGTLMSKLNIAGGIVSVADSFVDSINVFNNPESNGYSKTASGIRVGNSFLKLGKDVYMDSIAKSKVLQVISSAGKNTNVRNQILMQEQKLKYGFDKATNTKIKNVGATVTILTSYADGIANGIEQYGVVTEDGDFDWGDAGSVMLHFSTGGLSSMASSLTCGLVNVDGKSVADHLEADAIKFAHGDSWAANFIRNEENFAPARFAVSVGSGVYVIGENIYDGVVEFNNTVGSWVSATWDTVRDWF